MTGPLGAQTPKGEPFQINTTPVDFSANPAVAGADGEFLVVWQGSGLRAQRLDASGRPLAAEIEVLETAPGNHEVAMQPDGDFLVVWTDDTVDSISTQLFAADGTPKTDAQEVASYGDLKSVTTDTEGRFVIVYEDYGYLYTKDIQVRRLDADGQFLGAEVRAGGGQNSDVAATNDGGFVVAWTWYTNYIPLENTLVRKYDADGQPITSSRSVREFASRSLKVASTPDGFALDWLDREIETQFFGFDYSAQGPLVELLPHKTPESYFLDMASDADGRLVNTWYRNNGTFSRTAMEGGATLGDTFRLDTGTQSYWPRVANAAEGRFLSTFLSETSTAEGTPVISIQGRLLVDEDLFADGFEGGGPLAWGHVTGVPGCLPAAQLDCGDPVVRGDTNGPGTTRVLEN
ncbi:MAG: hypothetical protein AAGN66_29915, partial [Acidobacteriota bacterium]